MRNQRMDGPGRGAPNMGKPGMGGPNRGGPRMAGPNRGGPNMAGPNMGGPRANGRRQQKGRRIALIALMLVFVAALVGLLVCGMNGLLPIPFPHSTESKASSGESVAQTTQSAKQEEQAQQAEPRAWSEAEAPNYYLEVGRAQLSDVPERGVVRYSPLDSHGRAQGVVACIDAATMEEAAQREREDMQDLHPSGWGTNQEVDIVLPDGDTYHGYFWNRSHLLAKSLGGQAILENLVCGTRMQNVGGNLNGSEGGMAYTESLARSWLDKHPDGYLYYAATPEYAGEEPVCRDVVVDVKSSDGELDCRVVVFNAAKGFSIDYATGTFTATS